MVQIVGGMSSFRAQPVPPGGVSFAHFKPGEKQRSAQRKSKGGPAHLHPRSLLRGQQFQLWAALLILREASQRAPSRGPSSSAGAFAEKPEGRQDPGALGIRFSRASRHSLERAPATSGQPKLCSHRHRSVLVLRLGPRLALTSGPVRAQDAAAPRTATRLGDYGALCRNPLPVPPRSPSSPDPSRRASGWGPGEAEGED